MTAGLVTSVNPVQSVGAVKSSSQTEGGSDFLEIFRANADKNAGADNKEQQIVQKKQNAEDSSAKIAKEAAEAKKGNMPETKAEAKKDTNSDDISEDVIEAAGTVVNEIANVLEVSVEEVMDAIENLGMEITAVLDETNIPQIAVEITGAEDAMAIMTDEALFEDVKEITSVVEETNSDLAKELGVSEDELGDMIKSSLVQESDADKRIAKNLNSDSARENGSNAGEQMNFAQTVVENIKEAAQSSHTAEVGYTADMNEIYSQVSENLKLNMSEDVTEMEINLHPASLGNVKIQVAARDGMITANFVTQNEQVKAALEAQIVELKDNMNEQGIRVESIEITLASHAFEENLSKEGDSSASEGETKKKRRQINLNEIEDSDDIIIEDEIRIAREMMMHNGTTVDYMA